MNPQPADRPDLRPVEGNPHLDTYRPAENVHQAERHVIGTVIGSAEAARTAATVLTPRDFYWPQHEYAYTAAMALLADGNPIDVISVTRRLTRDGHNPAGGADIALADMFGEALPLASLTWHARTVREDAQRRRLHETCIRGVQATADPACDVAEAAARVAGDAHAVMEAAGAATELEHLGVDLSQLIDDIEAGIADAVPTGLLDLDRGLRIRPGNLVTVAARSGVGKSMFGVTVLRKIAINLGRPVLYASIEMTRAEVLARVLAAEATVDISRLTPNADGIRPSDQEWERISRVQPRIAAAPMVVDATKKGVTVSHLRSRLLREQAKGTPAALLIVDHIHIMTSVLYSADQRRHQLDEIARGLKVLAEEFGIPVVALAQLNRKSDDRPDRRPAVGDLFEASTIEHHSDSIILLHRPEKHEPEASRSGEIDLIVTKNRNGPEYVTTCGYQGHFGRIVDLTKTHYH